MPHLLRAQQFDIPLLETFFQRADNFRRELGPALVNPLPISKQSLSGSILFTVFYEPSTRTRYSFEVAGIRLGGSTVSTENAREFSSAIKGETLEDTIRVLCEYGPAAIVLRHFEEGAAERAANVSSCPIINAGDGAGQHPTQAHLDVYRIRRSHQRIDGLTVVIGGDLAHGRTARSLAYVLSKYGSVRLIFVAPPQLRMRQDILQHLQEHKIQFAEHDVLDEVVADADVVYWTRIQKERLGQSPWYKPWRRLLNTWRYTSIPKQYRITTQTLACMKPTAIIMHPLPRNSEIDPAVDKDPRAMYFKQAGDGVPIRMAALEWVCGLLT